MTIEKMDSCFQLTSFSLNIYRESTCIIMKRSLTSVLNLSYNMLGLKALSDWLYLICKSGAGSGENVPGLCILLGGLVTYLSDEADLTSPERAPLAPSFQYSCKNMKKKKNKNIRIYLMHIAMNIYKVFLLPLKMNALSVGR